MKLVIRRIDRALKRLYSLDVAQRAEDFLITEDLRATAKVANGEMKGALLVREEIENKTPTVSLGILLSAEVRNELGRFSRWEKTNWGTPQMNAFSVATEEVSHFHYLLHHAASGRGVSQFELELQGDIDRFLITFFALRGLTGHSNQELFDGLFQQFFDQFHLSEDLSQEERERYLEANHLARRFVRKFEKPIPEAKNWEKILKDLRRYYRLSAAEKLSFIRS